MNGENCSFYELLNEYKVEIPIIQRDYAQGRKRNAEICENFLAAIKNSLIGGVPINLDFIYGNITDNVFQPLDGQQRLTTLFLIHWYAYAKEKNGNDTIKKILKKFSYETRLSSRRFCESLVDNGAVITEKTEKISSQIYDSKWFFISWKYDSTIRAMLNSIDMIHSIFGDMENLWDKLTKNKSITFHLLILENFGLSDDLYIKMNARGRMLTPFENLKAELQDKSIKENWETNRSETDKFSYKIDTQWTDMLWKNFRKDNSVDNAHMNLITTLVMVKLSTGTLLKGTERTEAVRQLNEDNSCRTLIGYIDEDTFNYIYSVYELYYRLVNGGSVPPLKIDMWRHSPENNLLYQILRGVNTSYSHKVLLYAQTEYLLRNENINLEKYEEWMRVVRNILSRADLTPDGKRNDIVRSPESFSGAINLINEIAAGCGDIYEYLCTSTVASSFAREQVKEEILKAKIIKQTPLNKNLIFKTEDNELLRGKIKFALECAGYKSSIDEIDFNLLADIQKVFEAYFNKDLDNNNKEFDMLRRTMLTIEADGRYQFYNYWCSYWYAGEAEKRKLFPLYRELEYFIGRNEFKIYFKKLLFLLMRKNYADIIADFEKPDNMENWQYRLIKENGLLENCKSKYIAIPEDRSCCYLLKSKRPSDRDGSKVVT